MKLIILMMIAYLLGSIPSGLWIGQAFYKKNLRDHGSGNTGTTNTFRVLGVKAGIVVFIIDFLKGTLAVLLPMLLGVTTLSPVVFGLLAVLGHTYPVFAHFKGGKAVATSAGMLMGVAPVFCLCLVVVFATTLYLTSMISMSSMVAGLTALIGVYLLPSLGLILPEFDWVFTLVITIIALLIIIRHRDNLQRIRQKSENLVPWGLNLTRQQKKN